MALNVRKFAVGFLAISVLAGVFLLYMRLNRTPPIVVEPDRPAPAAEANGAGAKEPVGTIAGIGIGPIRQTRFQHKNEFYQTDREFGFEELLHEQGSQWQIARPYMKLYLEKFGCRVTADQGRVQLDDAFGRPMPTDAVFTGNVVIHIAPTDPNDPWECFIHLDDVGFLAEKSLFSSTGVVRFLSRAVRLTGTGMELVYDSPRSRLDRFRVFELDSLRLRSSEVKAASGGGAPDSKRRGADDSRAGKDPNGTVSTAPAGGRTPAPADVYQCVFRRNVRLDSPDGIVVAQDMLSINNIQWSRPEEPHATAGQAADPNGPDPVALPTPGGLNTAASSHLAMSSIPDELYDIVVTCDGGAEITLTSDARRPAEPAAAGEPESATVQTTPAEPAASDRQQIAARRIDFDFLTQDTTMLGPVAMKFLVDPNSLGEKAGGEPMPMEVTAQGAVRFLAASHQIVLAGGSKATLHRSEPNSSDEYRLTAPRLTLDLAVDANAADDVRVGLRRLVADGGPDLRDVNSPAGAPPVAVRMWRRASGRLLGWSSLDARELRYEKDEGRFTAAGPGVIWLHNAATVRSRSDPNAVLEACYARLSSFDTLKYWTLSNRIVAEDDAQQLQLDYFPLIDGKYGPQTKVVAGHIEATLQEIARSRLDLALLVASKGIEYDNEAEHYKFIGSEMVYDRVGSLITIRGDEVRPCYLNGALVDRIVVNPRTGQVEAQPVTSVFQIQQ